MEYLVQFYDSTHYSLFYWSIFTSLAFLCREHKRSRQLLRLAFVFLTGHNHLNNNSHLEFMVVNDCEE